MWDGIAENAALKVGTTARQLARTASDIGATGWIGGLSVLRSDAEELVRRADALARMTTVPLPEEPLPTAEEAAGDGAAPTAPRGGLPRRASSP